MIRALICDLDGTLFLGHGKTVFDLTQRNRDALEKLKENHIALYISSGRMARFGNEVLMHFGFEDLVSSGFNGGIGIDNGKTVFRHELSSESARKAMILLKEREFPYRSAQIQTYNDVRVFDDLNSPDVQRYREQIKETGIGRIADQEIVPYLKDPLAQIGKLSIRFHEETQAREAMELLHEEMEDCRITMSDRDLVDVISLKAQKGNLIDYLITQRSYRKEEIAAIGDGLNDVDMIQKAGWSFAMKNSDKELLKEADLIVEDVCECCERILE